MKSGWKKKNAKQKKRMLPKAENKDVREIDRNHEDEGEEKKSPGQ